MFEIETGIPVPDRTGQAKWPFRDMGVGDSVLFDDPLLAAKAQVRCHVYGAKVNKKFATRKEGAGIRVWRIE